MNIPKTRLDDEELIAFNVGIAHAHHGLDDHNPYVSKSLRPLFEAYQQGLSWHRILSKVVNE